MQSFKRILILLPLYLLFGLAISLAQGPAGYVGNGKTLQPGESSSRVYHFRFRKHLRHPVFHFHRPVHRTKT